MKKSTKASKTVMSGGMFMNSASSNDSNSDDDKCHLPTADLLFSDNDKEDEEPTVVIRRTTSKLKRQHATTSLQSPLSVRNVSSLESVDFPDRPILASHPPDSNRVSFNESERTDSGIGRNSGSSWRLSSLSESFPCSQSHSIQQRAADKRADSNSASDGDDDETTPIPQINAVADNRPSEDSLETLRLQKAGWLYVKHWLTAQRHRKVELASKRHWKRFWTCLKGTTLHLYNDYSDTTAKLTVSLVESLCYPLPEHPRRQHVFSLTTRTGDTYCLQASDQPELDHWIRALHCSCLSRTNELQLRKLIDELDEQIERENKMRKLGELQLKSSTSQKVRLLISKQIDLWERNLETFHVDLFRHKCYLCALANDRELPNPRDLLAQACPATKASLHKLSSFTPCSFYACIAARRQTDRQKPKYKLASTTVDDSAQTTKCYMSTPASPITSVPTTAVPEQTILQMVACDCTPSMRTIVSINEAATVGELLKRVTDKLGLQLDDHFLHFDATSPSAFVPNLKEKLNNLTYSSIDIRRKVVYSITLQQPLNLSGIEIITELHRECSLQVIVSNVLGGSASEQLGVRKGDELVIVNNFIVEDLDLDTLDRYLNETPMTLTLRASRLTEHVNEPKQAFDLSHAIIQNLICPPPPRRIERLSRQELRELVVPKPDTVCPPTAISSVPRDPSEHDRSGSALERLLKNVEELSRYCRPTTTLLSNEADQANASQQPPRVKALSNAQRMRKVIFELVETERSYVQDVHRLLERYIEPLRDDSKLLPTEAIESLYVSVKSIHQLQTTFLQRLESNVPTEVLAYNAVPEFCDILVSIADTFLSYSQYFKLYSTFCAMHLRINRLLDVHQNNQHLKEFLAARNPRHQHSSSFESYLIKPVQRILKYPLLLQQMLLFSTSADTPSDDRKECLKLKQAIAMMNDIGEYMNGMQQLYEDFGQSFESIIKTYSEEHNRTLQLNLPDLCAYGELEWINIHLFLLGKNQQRWKTHCFVFRHGCLLLVREQSNKKKHDLPSAQKGHKVARDRLLRFIPMEEIHVELLNINNGKDNIPTWQLTQTSPRTHLKAYFRFANKDAETFVRTINSCLSAASTTVEWRRNSLNRPMGGSRNSEPSFSLRKSSSAHRMSSSRSCHALLPGDSRSLNRKSSSRRRSPSPIWKRRTTPTRRPLLSMNIGEKTIRNSTDC